MNARDLTLQLNGKWHGRYGTAACPACQPEARRDQDALTLSDANDGRLLLHCKRSGCGFTDILAAAGVTSGDYIPPDPVELTRRQEAEERDAQRRAAQARTTWDDSVPIDGTVAKTYLRNRGITCELPPTLRFHPGAWHGPTEHRYPALVAAVSPLHGSSAPAVHRTYLRPDGSGKADITPAKMMLGRTAGGGVRLSHGDGPLVVAEGIETALSLLSGTWGGALGDVLGSSPTVVAALSTSGMRGLILPPEPECLLVASDGDEPGREAARDLGLRAMSLGWNAALADPGDGLDWNDLLQIQHGGRVHV